MPKVTLTSTGYEISKKRISGNDINPPTTIIDIEEALCIELIDKRERLEMSLKAYLRPILASQCRSLCQKMQLAFPQELRDMVSQRIYIY